MPTGRPTPLANAAIEIPPVITVDVIKPVSAIPVIVLNCSIFLASVHGVQFHQANMLQFQSIFLIDIFVVLVVLKGLSLDKFWFYCRIYLLFV